jgi:integrase
MENKKKKTTPRQNQMVKLREKELKSGGTSLYLDIYYKGKRYYEFPPEFRLKPGKTIDEKSHNKELRMKAEILRARRQLEIINGEYGFIPEFKKNLSLLDYFKSQMEKRKEGESNYQNWASTLKHLETFDKGNVRLSQINEAWLLDWHNHLKTTKTKNEKKLAKNTIFSYYNKMIACIKQAFKEKLISFNPAQTSIGVKSEDSKREYLTAEEVQMLINTECEEPHLKRAFLFSCLTGLRWSDVEKLTWEEVREDSIVFKQKKTGGLEYLPITEQAQYFLGERREETEKVFKLSYSAWNNMKLRDWARAAGIKKKVTFHVARHTMATLSLTSGTDLYTVGKLLGHRNIKTTQIYTKVIDSKKREAVDSLPKFKL